MFNDGISKPAAIGVRWVGDGTALSSLVQSVVPQRHGDQNGGKRAETENGDGQKVQEVALRIDPAHRQFEGNVGLTAAALSLAIPLLLTLCFLGVYLRVTAVTKRDRRHAMALYLLGLTGALFAIHAAIY